MFKLFTVKMVSERWCLMLCIFVLLPLWVNCGRTSMMTNNISKFDPEAGRDLKTSDEDLERTISDGQESIAAIDQNTIESQRRKLRDNATAETAEVAQSLRGSVNTTMTLHNDVVVERSLTADDEALCGRHKVCTMEESTAIRIEKLKRTILSKLNLERPPNVTVLPRNSPPVLEMMHKYGIQRTPPESEVYIDEEIVTKDVVAVARPPPFPGGMQDRGCYFHISEDTVGYDVDSAFLWIFFRQVRLGVPSILVDIRKYHAPSFPGRPPRTSSYKIVRLHPEGVITPGWKRVNVTDLVRAWVRQPEVNYGIKIHAIGHPDAIVLEDESNTTSHKPFIDMKLTMQPQHRSKRHAIRRCKASETNEPRCCLYDLEVNFEAIGWDWIIYPVTYNARLCSGECTMMQVENLRSKVLHHTDIARGRVSSCCVPKKMASISMLYHDSSSNIVFSRVPDMEITSCDCL